MPSNPEGLAMRLAADDVTRSLRASWRLLSADAKALPDLDLSRDGFWRSYLALVLTVPAIIPVLAAERVLAGLRFTGFIIAWNWACILSAGLIAVPAAVCALGWSHGGIAVIQALAFGTIILRLRYCVARATFGAESRIAGAIACASLLADYAIIRTFGLAGF